MFDILAHALLESVHCVRVDIYFFKISMHIVVQWSEVRTLNQENPGSDPVLSCQTLGECFHSALLQFIQLSK